MAHSGVPTPLPATMEIEQVFHMKEGFGETSYAQNSSVQKGSMEALKHIIINAALDSHAASETPETSMVMADLGCATGLNSLSLVGDIIRAISQRSWETMVQQPEFVVYLNDLPSNDFNAIFTNFPEFVERMRGGDGAQVFLAGVPGTFYGRLFANETLQFIFSCHSLHWLSQVPRELFNEEGKSINKGNIYISETSPPGVVTAYFKQFKKDFNLFLKSRSAELKPRGRMALLMVGRKARDYKHKSARILWDILAKSFAVLVSQGMVEKEKVDSYDMAYYAPSKKQIEDEVHEEGSFAIESIETCELRPNSGDARKDVKLLTMMTRSIKESMIKHHFGENIIDPLFQIFNELLTEAWAKERITGLHLIIVLSRLG